MSTAQLGMWAEELAGHGWPVFPLHPDSKQPALHSAEFCPRAGDCAGGHRTWEHRATTRAEPIRACWAHQPYNIGLATGPAGLLVVDCDVPKPDEAPPEGWNMLGITTGTDVLTYRAERAGGTIPDTYTVATPTGGRHLYFRAPAHTHLRNTTGRLGWLLDTRAHGGYVVAPGSLLTPGGYELVDDTEPAALPGWIVRALAPRPAVARSAPRETACANGSGYVASAVADELARVAAALPHRHNHTLFVVACRLGEFVGGGHLDETEARQRLTQAVEPLVQSPCRCTAREVERTIDSGLRAGASRPRHLGTCGGHAA